MSRITASALTAVAALAALAVAGSMFAFAHAGHKASAAAVPVATAMPAATGPAGDTSVPDALTALGAAASVSDSMPATF